MMSSLSIKVGDSNASAAVAEGALHATIELDLKQGVYDLETTLSGGKKPAGAYFAYVSFVE